MEQTVRLLSHTSLYGSICVALMAFSSPALSNPAGGVVTGGNASIVSSGKKLDVHQHSDRAVIDWRSFDIDADEHTQFHQPSSRATALNRVKSADPSRIAGKLSANGHVILVNPNGVMFDKGARVDVNGLIATSADIDNRDFMQGNLNFSQPGDPDAVIVNHGEITAGEAGLVGLVAPRVENHGVIRARLGKVQLASGDRFTVDLHGDGLLSVEASDAVASQLVANTGRISAEGGEIALSAAAGRELVDSLIVVEGELKAPTIQAYEGRIVVTGQDANITVSGTLDASGLGGAGEILVGGDFQGKGLLPTAYTTTITQGAVITANVVERGDGGTIIVWSDETTKIAGRIEAKGGAQFGAGGFIETSGKQTLSVKETAHVDSGGGTWLLDPTDIIIDNSGNPNTIAPATITTGLATNNIVIHTGNVGADQGDITVSNVIVYTSGNDLTLLAHRNINANADIQNRGAGDINLVAGWNGTTGFAPGVAGQAVGTVNMTDILNSANNAYGNNNGSVVIDASIRNVNTQIGSKNGDTTAAGYDVLLRGGTTSDDLVMLGFYTSATHTDPTGDINVYALNDVSVLGGTGGGAAIANGAYAQIGHGRVDLNSNYSGDIYIKGQNLIMDSGPQQGAYAAIGMGPMSGFGAGVTGNIAGDITIDLTGDLTMDTDGTTAGRWDNPTVIGHGDDDGQNSGSRSGDIVINVGGELSLIDLDPNDDPRIGHETNTSGGVSNANVRILAEALDFSAAATGTYNINDANFLSFTEANLISGDVTIGSTGANGLIWSNAFTQAGSTNTLSLLSADALTLGADISHTGGGTVNLASGWDGTTGLLSNQALATYGQVDFTAIGTSGITNNRNMTHTAGTVTAGTINLQAGGTMAAALDATNVDIGSNASGAALTGLVGGGADQAAADMITGGPGNNNGYTFEGFTIRYVAPAPGGGGGGSSTPSEPVTDLQPEEPPVGTLSPTPPEMVTSPQPPLRTGVTPSSQESIPSTVEFVSQHAIHSASYANVGDGMSDNAGLILGYTNSESVSNDMPRMSLDNDVAAFSDMPEGMLNVTPELVRLFRLDKEQWSGSQPE